MRFSFRSVTAMLGLALCAGGHATQVIVHDPVMAQDGARYYLFGTGPGIPFYSSADLLNWQREGRVFAGAPAWASRAAPGFNGHIWAPDVQQHQGKFYLYYSVSAFGKNRSGIGVTVSKTLDPRSPDYRWEDQGMLLQSVPGRDDWNAIDPNIVEDGEGGAWMAFGSFWSGVKLVKLDHNWTQLAEPQQWHAIARRNVPVRSAASRPERARSKRHFSSAKMATTTCSPRGACAARARTAPTAWWSAARRQ